MPDQEREAWGRTLVASSHRQSRQWQPLPGDAQMSTRIFSGQPSSLRDGAAPRSPLLVITVKGGSSNVAAGLELVRHFTRP